MNGSCGQLIDFPVWYRDKTARSVTDRSLQHQPVLAHVTTYKKFCVIQYLSITQLNTLTDI